MTSRRERFVNGFRNLSGSTVEKMNIDQSLFRSLVQCVKDYAIFALNPEGYVITWNAGAERTKGYTVDEIIGKHFSIFYTQDDRDRNHADFVLQEVMKNGSHEEESWRVRKDDSLFLAHVTITAIYDDVGKHLGFSKVIRDLTGEKAAFAQANEEVFEHMVGSVKDYAIFKLNVVGIVQTWNRGAERIKGYRAEEIIGKHFSVFYGEEAKRRNHPDFELKEAGKNGSYSEEGWRIKKDGTQFWASVTITAIRDKHGKLAGFLKVTRDLTERKRFEQELEDARDEAILANQLKTRFVANITHEIRTPLGGIVGLSELIAESNDGDPEIRDAGRRIFDASKKLLGLLNDLLDFARLEAGKMEVDNQPFSIVETFADVSGLLMPEAEERGLHLTFKVDEKLPAFFVSDATKIRQILLNLISNSLKFTVSGGVEVAAESQTECVQFSVTDTGIGVSEEKLDSLFKPFTQGHEATFGGTGLGLSICQQFVELMGGRIGMLSLQNEGTTVWFTIPLSKGKQA